MYRSPQGWGGALEDAVGAILGRIVNRPQQALRSLPLLVCLTLANKRYSSQIVTTTWAPLGDFSVYICAYVCWCKCGSYKKTLSIISWVPSLWVLAWSSPSRLGWPANELWGSIYLHLLSPCIESTGTTLAFVTWVQGSHSGPHVYMTGTLPTEPSAQSPGDLFKMQVPIQWIWQRHRCRF